MFMKLCVRRKLSVRDFTYLQYVGKDFLNTKNEEEKEDYEKFITMDRSTLKIFITIDNCIPTPFFIDLTCMKEKFLHYMENQL